MNPVFIPWPSKSVAVAVSWVLSIAGLFAILFGLLVLAGVFDKKPPTTTSN